MLGHMWGSRTRDTAGPAGSESRDNPRFLPAIGGTLIRSQATMRFRHWLREPLTKHPPPQASARVSLVNEIVRNHAWISIVECHLDTGKKCYFGRAGNIRIRGGAPTWRRRSYSPRRCRAGPATPRRDCGDTARLAAGARRRCARAGQPPAPRVSSRVPPRAGTPTPGRASALVPPRAGTPVV